MNEAERYEKQKIQRDAIRNELKILTSIGEHPNIIKLLGIVTMNRAEFCIITEYCENGSLDNFLDFKYKNEYFVDQVFTYSKSIYHQALDPNTLILVSACCWKTGKAESSFRNSIFYPRRIQDIHK